MNSFSEIYTKIKIKNIKANLSGFIYMRNSDELLDFVVTFSYFFL